MNAKELLEDLGIEVILFYPESLDNQSDGIYLPDDRVIFVNGFLDEVERGNIILHELGHVNYGHYHYDCQPAVINVSEENQADRYMLQHRAKEYLESFEEQPDYIDIYRFLELFHFARSLYDMAYAVFENLLGYSNQ